MLDPNTRRYMYPGGRPRRAPLTPAMAVAVQKFLRECRDGVFSSPPSLQSEWRFMRAASGHVERVQVITDPRVVAVSRPF